MKRNDVFRRLKELGWYFHRQGKGTHQIWRRGKEQLTVSAKTLDGDPRSLKNLLAQAK